MLVAHLSGQRIEAEEAVKSQDYICPSCRKIVRVRRRRNYVTHFYHLVLRGCAWENEGPMHRLAKRVIGEEYRRRGFEIAYEWTIADEKQKSFSRAVTDALPDRRTDLMIWRGTETATKAYAVEIQDSAMSREEFVQRCGDWGAFGVQVLWLSIPRSELMAYLKQLVQENAPGRFESYAPRPFERMMLQRMQCLWFILPDASVLFQALAAPHRIAVERYTGFDHSAGDFFEVGGYEYNSARYIDLSLSAPRPVSSIKIIARGRNATWQ